MSKAVFLDRDGVINPLVYNILTHAYESPKHPGDFSVFTYAAKALRLLKINGYKTILISNQPDYAKGKAKMEDLLEIAKMLSEFSVENYGLIDDYYYCYHHPQGIVAEYTKDCLCRKPGTLFVEEAIKKHTLERSQCFFIGDRKSDMECGTKAGVRTIRIVANHSQDSDIERNQICAMNLFKAAQWIVRKEGNTG